MPELVLVRAFELRKTQKQENYASLRLNLGRDGQFADVEAKVWQWDVKLREGRVGAAAAGDLLRVGVHKVESYRDRPQWIIESFELVAPDERDEALAQFVPPERIDRRYYRQRLDELIERTSPERVCGQVLREIYDDPAFREAFYLAPAARDHHQNYPGGLLEHTINVTSVALCIAEAYAAPSGAPGNNNQAGRLTFNRLGLPLDREVLIAAGLLHDIGKLQTYRFEPLPECTETNNWEGHLVLSYYTVRRLAEPLLAAPPYPGAADELNKLLHCILSHHGLLEYGSPVVPACTEAFILSQADLTDARLAEIVTAGDEAHQREGAARWLRNQPHFRGGLFVGDWILPGNGDH